MTGEMGSEGREFQVNFTGGPAQTIVLPRYSLNDPEGLAEVELVFNKQSDWNNKCSTICSKSLRFVHAAW